MRTEKHILMDIDGVIVRGARVIPGAPEFIGRLAAAGRKFLVLTNNPAYTPRDLSARLTRMGIAIPETHIFTAALATAQFLHSQRPEGTAYVLGEAGLTTALHDAGYTLTDQNPDYVILGVTTSYDFERITRAVRLIAAGSRFIATSPDVVGPTESGLEPGTGAVAALITAATGVGAYFVGKPNPLMMRAALRTIGTHSEETMMIGDRMDTDIIAGTEAGMETTLVLTGVTPREQVERFPYQPTNIVASIAEIEV